METHPKILKTSIRIEFGHINNSPCMCLGLDLISDRAPQPLRASSTDVRDNLELIESHPAFHRSAFSLPSDERH